MAKAIATSRLMAVEAAGITINSGPRPQFKVSVQRSTWSDVCEAAQALREGQWFTLKGSQAWDEPRKKGCLGAIKRFIKKNDLKFLSCGTVAQTGEVIVSHADDGTRR